MNRSVRNIQVLKTRLMSSVSPPSLLVRQARNTLFIELNRPKALNSLSLEMCDEITEMLSTKINVPQSTVAAFVMKGNGGKAFCAG